MNGKVDSRQASAPFCGRKEASYDQGGEIDSRASVTSRSSNLTEVKRTTTENVPLTKRWHLDLTDSFDGRLCRQEELRNSGVKVKPDEYEDL